MKNIILILFTAFALFSCNGDGPIKSFSLKGIIVENCNTGKPVAGASFVLVCRDYDNNKPDAVIPFRTNADGSFFVNGEPNYPYYFVTDGYNQISSGVVFIDAMAPKHYDIGTISNIVRDTSFYPCILKYDITASTFQEGDTLKTYNEMFKDNIQDKLSVLDFLKPDTVFIKGNKVSGRAHFPDPVYSRWLVKNGFDGNVTSHNIGYLSYIHRQNGVKTKINYAFNFVYSCDKYPVVTVKLP